MPTAFACAIAPVIVIAPDSFKGSLTARQVAEAIGRGILESIPDAHLRLCPIADGGEGTLDAMLHAGGEIGMLMVRDARGVPRAVPVAQLQGGGAVIESAEIVGITDAAAMAQPIGQRSTEGVGDAIRLLLDNGVRQFHVALGGSSTNDGGAGMLCALGMKMFDRHGAPLSPGPQALEQLARIDVSGLDPRLAHAQIVGMSDVDNPLCGENGASAIFGPQKGLPAEQVTLFDRWLAHYAQMLDACLGSEHASRPGAGAAGGLGYALMCLGATLQSGAQTVCDVIGLDGKLAGAQWLITGEGRSDGQTLQGKAPFIAAQRARAAGVASSLLSGAIDQSALPSLRRHFSGCFSIVPGPLSLASAIEQAEALTQAGAAQMAAVWAAARAAHNK